MTVRYAHEMQAGDRYAPLRFTATAELNQQFLFAVDDFNPLFLEGRDGQPPLVHPVLLMHMTPRTRSPSYRQAPGMGSAFARDRSAYRAPAYVGSTLLVEWEVTQTYEQRGKIYQDYRATIRDENGREVLRRELASTFFTQGKVKTYGLERQA